MNQIAKHAYFALVVSMTLTTAATVQSETAQSETHKSVNGSGDNVDLSVEAKSEHFRQEREALADDPFFGGGSSTALPLSLPLTNSPKSKAVMRSQRFVLEWVRV